MSEIQTKIGEQKKAQKRGIGFGTSTLKKVNRIPEIKYDICNRYKALKKYIGQKINKE